METFEQCDITHQHCYILNQVLSQLSAIRTQVSSDVNHTVEVIHQLIRHIDIEDTSNTESRLKRGLFDFIGSISKSLFAQQLLRIHHKHLFISIKFPISTFVNPLTLYKINSYPVPINTTSNHATQLLDLPQYLVITSYNRQYAELSDDFIKTCSGIDTLYFIAQDNNFHLSLKRIAKAAKADRKIFTSLSEPLLDGEIDIDDSCPNTNEMISLISLVLSILLTIACIILFNKVRALTTVLILLQKAPSSAAFVTPQTPPTFHYMQSPISTTQNYDSLLSPLNQWPSIVLAAITIISFVGALHYLYKQVCTRHHTKIILEISNGLTCLTIPVVNLPFMSIRLGYCYTK
ncbi:unnamed protein product [Mytilus edulis]|uniref:Uncharacterized protein n=1 Tax=Mytilus edulis TaxID=6550 RepID=A0A8S3VF24_MYTED|nr:unnamed protein product [Mytilus edulis]